MSKTKEYTQIPPTSDLSYWRVKEATGSPNRSITFAPRYPELHLRLKREAWKLIQAKLPFNLRTRT